MPTKSAGCWRWPPIYDGATRTEAAGIGGVTLQIVRDWVIKFNAQGPDGLVDRKAPGQKPLPGRTGIVPPCASDDRERADPCGASRGALAHHRPLPMGLGPTGSACPSRRSAASCARWGIASCRLGRIETYDRYPSDQ